MKHTIYQVLPRLWRNGKFSDWDESCFDHLKTLGVDYVWYTGIPRHATGKYFVKGDPGCPYAVSDWCDTNPYLADDPDRRMQEFEQLVARTHEAGLKVLIDFIPNHVAKDYDGPVPHLDRCDYDWTDTLKVDYDNPDTVPAMISILEFWVERGVDGFRCDMVELVSPEALGRIVFALKQKRNDLLFVAETYGKQNYRTYLEIAGFDLLYDKSGAYDILRGICCHYRSAVELSYNWQWLDDMQDNMVNFLENHDEQRIASPWWCGGRTYPWAAVAFSRLFNTASDLIYFGQEAGENAEEGHMGRTSIFSWSEPRTIGRLGRGELNAEETAMLERYRRISAMAIDPVFREGANWDLGYCQPKWSGFNADKHFAFARFTGMKACVVLCNFSPVTASVEVCIPEELKHVISADCVRLTAAPLDFDFYFFE